MWKTPSALVVIVLILLALGIVMLASTSSVKGQTSFHDPLYFLKRQLIWLFIALLVGFVASLVDYHHWQRLVIPLGIVSFILLVLVFAPGIGLKVGGSHRWLRIGPVSFQPSELAKFTVVLMLASWMSRVQARAGNLREGLFLPGMLLGPVLVLILAEPDFGTTLLTAAVGLAIMYVGGTKPRYLLVCGVVGVCAMALYVMHDPVRMGRILAFVEPDKYPEAAYQLGQSKDAFMMGGRWGVGLGESLQKHLYLPEAHTDFILAIIGEELGLPATGLVVGLFLGLLICGLVISFRAPDVFGRLLGFGITVMVTLQCAINVGVVTGCLPTKGLPLPFISYGGSSLMLSLLVIGVLVNIARHSTGDMVDEHTYPIKDRAHRF